LKEEKVVLEKTFPLELDLVVAVEALVLLVAIKVVAVMVQLVELEKQTLLQTHQ
tara:strand:+ start:307 stop:468 length:162 start_codon:yes stop_codon:yes gene_type:complete